MTYTSLQGSNDVFVTKFLPDGAGLVYSTYLGGTNFDVGQGIAADSDGNAYITGYTGSTNFPVTIVLAPLFGQLNDNTNAFRRYSGARQPPYDAFVAKIAPEGAELLYCAYLGGTNNDSGYRIRLDAQQGVYVAGASSSFDFPNVPQLTTNIVPRGVTNYTSFFNSDAFLTKLIGTNGEPAIQYSLLFGGPQNETAWDVAVQPGTSNIFITGSTTSTNFPAFPISATNAPFLAPTNFVRSNDVFVAAFAPAVYSGTNYYLTNEIINGQHRRVLVGVLATNVVLTNLYAVMFGGLQDDYGLGINVDSLGNAFVCGQTLSGLFPVLNPLQPALVGHSDGFLAKIQFPDSLSAVTIDTAPPNLPVVVDGVTNRAPVTTNWAYGSGHWLSVLPVESGGPGTQGVWTAWSNGGLISNRVSPSSPITNYTAEFTTQYLLTMDWTPGGGVQPGTSWYDAGSVVPITATPGVGSSFVNWTGTGPGGFSGTNNPASVTMMGPITELATFSPVSDSVLRVIVNGPGTLLPNLNGQTLQVGQTYRMTAMANPGALFAGWSGDVDTNAAKLSFVMTNNMVIVATFTPSPFPPLAATYTGLFSEADNLNFQSSGLATVTLSAGGACSVAIRPGGTAYSVSGQFSTNGTFYGVISRPKPLPAVQVRLVLDFANTNRLTGQISAGTWNAGLEAYRPFYSPARPAPEAGRTYLLRFPGNPNSLAGPGGDGYATITVHPLGTVTLKATLGDGTTFSQSTFITSSGQWPLFGSLYSSQGSILGWLSFSGTNPDGVGGTATWFKWPLPALRRLYPGGFVFQTDTSGASYIPAKGRALNFSPGRAHPPKRRPKPEPHQPGAAQPQQHHHRSHPFQSPPGHAQSGHRPVPRQFLQLLEPPHRALLRGHSPRPDQRDRLFRDHQPKRPGLLWPLTVCRAGSRPGVAGRGSADRVIQRESLADCRGEICGANEEPRQEVPTD